MSRCQTGRKYSYLAFYLAGEKLENQKGYAGPGGRAVSRVGLRPPACYCGFESHQGHGRLLCCVLSGRGLCDELITRPWECDLEIT
jgi:hypothetical protein